MFKFGNFNIRTGAPPHHNQNKKMQPHENKEDTNKYLMTEYSGAHPAPAILHLIAKNTVSGCEDPNLTTQKLTPPIWEVLTK